MELVNGVEVWVCYACMSEMANGETPEGEFENRTRYVGENEVVYPGGAHDLEFCAKLKDGVYDLDAECDCETIGFSSKPCDTCENFLAGERFAATLFEVVAP